MEKGGDRTIDAVFKDFLESTTIHGLPKISSSKRIAVKLLWLCVFISVVVLFALQLDRLIKEYNSNPKQTTITLQSGTLKFPAITICNMNTVKRSNINLHPQLEELVNTNAFEGSLRKSSASLDPRQMDVYELILNGFAITENFQSKYFEEYSYWEMVDYIRNIYYVYYPKPNSSSKLLSRNEILNVIGKPTQTTTSTFPTTATTTPTLSTTMIHSSPTPNRRKRAGNSIADQDNVHVTLGPATNSQVKYEAQTDRSFPLDSSVFVHGNIEDIKEDARRTPKELTRNSSRIPYGDNSEENMYDDASGDMYADGSGDLDREVTRDTGGDMYEDGSEDLDREVTRDTSGDLYEDGSEDLDREVTRDTSGDLYEDGSEDLDREDTRDASGEMYEDGSGDLDREDTRDASGEMYEDGSEDLDREDTRDTGGDMYEDGSGDLDREVTRDTSGDLYEDGSEDLDREVTRDTSGDLYEDGSEDLDREDTRDASGEMYEDGSGDLDREDTRDASGEMYEDGSEDLDREDTRDTGGDMYEDGSGDLDREVTRDATGDMYEDGSGDNGDSCSEELTRDASGDMSGDNSSKYVFEYDEDDMYAGKIVGYSATSSAYQKSLPYVYFPDGLRVELTNTLIRSRPIFKKYVKGILDEMEYQQPLVIWKARTSLFEAILRQQSRDLRFRLGHQFEDLMLSAYFGGEQENVTHSAFWNNNYGNCYTIDSPKYETRHSGPGHGFDLLLNLEMDEYLSRIQESQGVRILLHEQGTVPFPNAEGITLAPGYEHQIGLKIVGTSRLGPPYGICTDGKDFLDKYNRVYTLKTCTEICKIDLYVNECGCVPHDSTEIFNKYVDLPVCKYSVNSSVKACADRIHLKLNGEKDICGCVEPCRTTSYLKTISGRPWPTDNYLTSVIIDSLCAVDFRIQPSMIQICGAHWEDKLDVKKYRNNFMKIQIYFEDTQYQLMSEEPTYGVVRFLSDIGGTAGLFMGASVLSIVEIVQVVLEIIIHLRKGGQMFKETGQLGRNDLAGSNV